LGSIRLVTTVSTFGPPTVHVSVAALLLVAVVFLGPRTKSRSRQFMEADRVDGPSNGEPAPAFIYFETFALLLLFLGSFAQLLSLNYNLFFSHFTCGGPDAPSPVSSAWRWRQRRKKCWKRSIHNTIDLFLLVTVTILTVFGGNKPALDKNLYRILLAPITVSNDSDTAHGSTACSSAAVWLRHWKSRNPRGKESRRYFLWGHKALGTFATTYVVFPLPSDGIQKSADDHSDVECPNLAQWHEFLHGYMRNLFSTMNYDGVFLSYLLQHPHTPSLVPGSPAQEGAWHE